MYSLELRTLSKEILEKGRQRFDLEMGIVSRISGDEYTILDVSSQSNVFVAGDTFSLQDTFCRDVVKTGSTIAIKELGGNKHLSAHPLYINLPLRAYISTPIMVDNAIWGTLNFSSLKAGGEPFTDEDIQFIEGESRELGLFITGWNEGTNNAYECHQFVDRKSMADCI